MPTLDDVAALVAEQVERITDPRVRAALERLLVAPREVWLPWDYGDAAGYPGFVVGEHRPSRTGLAYAEDGFGPSCPWGLIDLAHPGFGMDCNWYTTLEGAFRDSLVWDEPPPEGYQVD